MSKINQGLKATPVAGDLILGKDSENGNQIVEFSVGSFDVGQSVIAGIPDYNAGTTYAVNELAMSGTGVFCRSLAGANTGNALPLYNTADTIWWEKIGQLLPEHNDTQDLHNIPVAYAGTIIMPNGNVTTSSPSIGFGVGQYFQVLEYFRFFLASRAYDPGEHVIHTDGLIYVKQGTSSTAAAWVVGWGDGQWQPLNAVSPVGQAAFISFGADTAASGSWEMFDEGTPTIHQPAGFGLGISGNFRLEFSDPGTYMVEVVWGCNGFNNPNAWCEMQLSISSNLTTTIISNGISRPMSEGNEGNNAHGVIKCVSTVANANMDLRIVAGSGTFGIDASRTHVKVTRIA